MLNLGVPGYGTDQAFLRYRRYRDRLEADIVILGIWPENICRNLNVMRYYLVPTGNFASKPRFIRKGDGLGVVNSPVLTGEALVNQLAEPQPGGVLRHDHWFRPHETRPAARHALMTVRAAESLYTLLERRQERQRLYAGEDPAGIDITVAIAGQFAQEVRDAGSEPCVLLLPMRSLLAMQTSQPPFPLVRELRESGVRVIDLGPRFLERTHEHGTGRYFLPSGHLNPEGNRLVAELLARELAASTTFVDGADSGSG